MEKYTKNYEFIYGGNSAGIDAKAIFSAQIQMINALHEIKIMFAQK